MPPPARQKELSNFLKGLFPQIQFASPCPVAKKLSTVNWVPSTVLLSSYIGTWSLISYFKWNFTLQNLLSLHFFCCTDCIPVRQPLRLSKTGNKSMYGRILSKQYQVCCKGTAWFTSVAAHLISSPEDTLHWIVQDTCRLTLDWGV